MKNKTLKIFISILIALVAIYCLNKIIFCSLNFSGYYSSHTSTTLFLLSEIFSFSVGFCCSCVVIWNLNFNNKKSYMIFNITAGYIVLLTFFLKFIVQAIITLTSDYMSSVLHDEIGTIISSALIIVFISIIYIFLIKNENQRNRPVE